MSESVVFFLGMKVHFFSFLPKRWKFGFEIVIAEKEVVFVVLFHSSDFIVILEERFWVVLKIKDRYLIKVVFLFSL